jgi:hypothetical protein
MTLDEFLVEFETALRDPVVTFGVVWDGSPVCRGLNYNVGDLRGYRHSGCYFCEPLTLVEWCRRGWEEFPQSPGRARRNLGMSLSVGRLIHDASNDFIGDCPVDDVAVVRFRLLDAMERGRGAILGQYKAAV